MDNNENNRLNLASIALENGNAAEAIKYSTEVLELNSENASAWLIKGVASAYIATGKDVDLRYKEALACLNRARELDPEMSEVDAREEEVKELISDFLCTLGFDTWQSAVQIANIGVKSGSNAYSNAGDLPKQAIDYYERALLVDETNVTALESVINIHKELGQVELVSQQVERLRALDSTFKPPSNRLPESDALGDLGDGLSNIGMILGAIALLLIGLLSLITVFKRR